MKPKIPLLQVLDSELGKQKQQISTTKLIAGNISFPLLCNKLPHTYQLKNTLIYYVTVSVGQGSGHNVWGSLLRVPQDGVNLGPGGALICRLWGRICFQTLSGYWPDLVPCGCWTKVPFPRWLWPRVACCSRGHTHTSSGFPCASIHLYTAMAHPVLTPPTSLTSPSDFKDVCAASKPIWVISLF